MAPCTNGLSVIVLISLSNCLQEFVVVGAGDATQSQLYRSVTNGKEVGSLCSGLTPDHCKSITTVINAKGLLDCAVACTVSTTCKSFAFQVQAMSGSQQHRCEMTSTTVLPINSNALMVPGYKYYVENASNLTSVWP